MNIGRQNGTVKIQEYFFIDGKNEWEIVYSVFSYPSKEDRKPGDFWQSLAIQMTYPDKFGRFRDSTGTFGELIRFNEEGITMNFLGYNPTLEYFNKLGERKTILEELSPEARNLLERGLEKYEKFQKRERSSVSS